MKNSKHGHTKLPPSLPSQRRSEKKEPVKRELPFQFIWEAPLKALEQTHLSELCFQAMCLGILLSFLGPILLEINFFALHLLGGINESLAPYFPDFSNVFFKLDKFYSTSAGKSFGWFSLPFLFGGLFLFFFLLENTLDHTWGQLTSPTIIQKCFSYWMVFSTAGLPFLLHLSLQPWVFLGRPSVFTLGITFMSGILFSGIFFSLSYRTLGKDVLSWRACFAGGMIKAIVFEALSFPVFFAQIKFLQNYGANGLIWAPILMLAWTALVCFFFLWGARLSYYFQYHSPLPDDYYLNLKKQVQSLQTERERSIKEISLICLLELTRKFSCPFTRPSTASMFSFPMNNLSLGMTPHELARICNISPRMAMKSFVALKDAGFITILNDGRGEVGLLNFSPDQFHLKEFLSRMDNFPGAYQTQSCIEFSSNRWFWEEYNRILVDTFQSITLKDLYLLGERHGLNTSDESFNEKAHDHYDQELSELKGNDHHQSETTPSAPSEPSTEEKDSAA